MKILVANLGSTSFKYRLYDLGDRPSRCSRAARSSGSARQDAKVVDPVAARRGRAGRADRRPRRAVQLCLDQLTDPELGVLAVAAEVAAIGFKAVHARDLTGVQRVDERVLAGDGSLRRRRPGPQPAVHQGDAAARRAVAGASRWWPRSRPASTRRSPRPTQRYAVPDDWATEYGIRRWGFHGASHRYIAGRMAELLGRADLEDDLVPPGRQLVALRDPRRASRSRAAWA